MGLGWELHELIQDFVDGKLSPERAQEVQAFLDRHPIAQQVADQYRQVTQPDCETLEDSPSESSLADRVMASIDRTPWYSLFKKPAVITGISLAVALPFTFLLIEPTVLFGWIQSQIVTGFSSLGTINEALSQFGERLGTASPFVIASILIAGFWGIVDRLIRRAHQTEQA